ncbi:MAG: DUF2069 domain-containing protein [Gammaproteobacteria bacterium]|jgi:uncharacterized membrane protein|nr:DUF2069 domain-containing protein [Gammaproteobacteria bacterium]
MNGKLYALIVRSTWLLLTLWQPLWHGWLEPQRWLLGVMLGLTLLLPLAGIWLLRPQAVIIGSLLAIGLLTIACMELVADGLNSPGAMAQLLFSGSYLLAVMVHGRGLKQAAKHKAQASENPHG